MTERPNPVFANILTETRGKVICYGRHDPEVYDIINDATAQHLFATRRYKVQFSTAAVFKLEELSHSEEYNKERT